MSTDDLRRELDRISEAAPPVHVAHDTWARARRSALRDRVAIGGAALAVAATVAVGVTWLPDRIDPPVTNTQSVALPDHLYPVPRWMSDRNDDGSWKHSEVSDDLDVGVAVAAWVSPWGVPVVVGADDGYYHLLDLPGFSEHNTAVDLGYRPATALSPDGTQLAYSWATFGPDPGSAPITSGVRVADLTTGTVRDFVVEGEQGSAIGALAWSDDGRWLAFEGAQPDSWKKDPLSLLCGECAVAGRIDLASGASGSFHPEEIDAYAASVAVDDSGEVSVIANGFVQRWDGTTDRRLDPDAMLSLGTGTTPSDGTGRVFLGDALGRSFTVLDGERAEEVDLGAPDDEQWGFSALGTFGDRVLAVIEPISSSGRDLRGGGELRLIPLDGGPGSQVGVADPQTQGSLTIAYRILDPGHLTAERPEPDWPWSPKRWHITIGLGAVAAWAAIIVLRRRWRRHRAAR